MNGIWTSASISGEKILFSHQPKLLLTLAAFTFIVEEAEDNEDKQYDEN